ncbi:8831_t:CDS:1 [Cetraspora pellucida]|uniref:8831_t:CDS:1 n=1 Tax=Cetraspora pellucida TaxID=1433469 RepID=A0A9N8YQE3_9GLOM|nr:8831_t:CDS:1 [Cetraspora pellucida]
MGAMVPYRQTAMVRYRQPQQFPRIFTPQYSYPQEIGPYKGSSSITSWKVPWITNIIIRTRPHQGKTCSRCGAMGHTSRTCQRVYGNHAIRNNGRIRKSVKKYFENPTFNMNVCICCGEIGHTTRNCPTRNAGGRGMGAGNCINAAHLAVIKGGIDKFKKAYNMERKLIPQFMLPPNIIPQRHNLLTY